MNPYEFGYTVGTLEKQAVIGALGARAGQIAGMLGAAGKTINTGAKHLVRGTGGVIGGLGHVADAAGAAGKAVGRGMMQGGQRTLARGDKINPGILRDILKTLGHGTRAGGRAVNAVSSGAGMAGKGMKATQEGLKRVSQMGYGVPTAAAIGLGAGASAIAPKLPLPSISLHSPIDLDFSYKTRNPVEVNW